MGQVGKLGVAGRMPNYQFDQVKIISHPDVLSIPEVYHTICSTCSVYPRLKNEAIEHHRAMFRQRHGPSSLSFGSSWTQRMP